DAHKSGAADALDERAPTGVLSRCCSYQREGQQSRSQYSTVDRFQSVPPIAFYLTAGAAAPQRVHGSCARPGSPHRVIIASFQHPSLLIGDFMSKTLRILGIIVVVVILLLVIVPFLIPVDKFRPTIEQKASQALGRQV